MAFERTVSGGFLHRQWEENGWFSRVLPVGTFALCLLLALVMDQNAGIDYTFLTIIGGFLLIALIVSWKISGRMITEKEILLLLFLAGFLLRLHYLLYTPVNMSESVRQHDVSVFGEDSHYQSDYIAWFYEHPFTLPEDPTYGQFYHPPLHFWLAAMWMRFLTGIGATYEKAASNIQFLTLFYSSCCMIVTQRLLSSLQIRKGGKITAFAIVAFHPCFIYMAGSINNDILSILLILLSLYTTVRWVQDPTWKKILPIALSIGLAMSAKLTAALAAFPIALVFLLCLIREKGKRLQILGQFAAFGCVSFPLGLWFALRKKLLYGVPLAYAESLDVNSYQYIGFRTLKERFFDLSLQPFRNIYLNRGEYGYYEYNPIIGLLKTSLTGEWVLAEDGTIITLLVRVLFAVNVILILLSIVSMVCCMIDILRRLIGYLSQKHGFGVMEGADVLSEVLLVSYQIISFVYYLYFCISYPHTCSMDIRYIAPSIVAGAVLIGDMLGRMEKHISETGCRTSESVTATADRRISLKAESVAVYLIRFATAGFCCLAAAIYLLVGVL